MDFEKRNEAEEALSRMNGGQIDRNTQTCETPIYALRRGSNALMCTIYSVERDTLPERTFPKGYTLNPANGVLGALRNASGV